MKNYEESKPKAHGNLYEKMKMLVSLAEELSDFYPTGTELLKQLKNPDSQESKLRTLHCDIRNCIYDLEIAVKAVKVKG